VASPRTFDVAGVNPIPLSAVAVSGNVTVVGQTSGGYVSLTPKATATPKSSTINVPVGDTRANNFTVPLDATGELSAVFKGAPGSKAHVLADITGYFVEGDGHGTYDTIAPARVLDSRTGDGRHLQPHDRRADGGRLCLDHAPPRTLHRTRRRSTSRSATREQTA
jgi:hypothetical protein